ncbi:12469_t:CDS:2 [Ambispora leptoticha]|uniref:12469_t:CDS:1 n=1 Tax=Ambispora leptoticha TaxID=144679 RepID=A0A9N9FGZ0_9GLOM|nr:12469_t:CDS:2 [Ambispora leptoticha]
MKFGKQLLNQQITEWASHYINYKGMKKIINSLKSTEAATNVNTSNTNTHHRNHINGNGDSNRRSLTSSTMITLGPRYLMKAIHAENNNHTNSGIPFDENQTFLQQQKTSFFFKLERELEKVNSFYLQKEAEFRVRLRTLIDKKKILLARKRRLSAGSASLTALKEGFQQFQQDLNKLQQFIEINATGFRKILKKWDKRSKSSTKELYLSRQVEIQPCFNRDIITELADNARDNLLELEDIASGLSNSSPSSPYSPERKLSIGGESQTSDVMDDLETELFKAITTGSISSVQEILERIRDHPTGENRDQISRVFWRACSEGSTESIQLLAETNLINYKYMDDISDRTCLHEAAIVGRTALAKLCVEHEVNVNCTDVYGRQPLHYVCMYGHNEAATYLLSVNAKIENIDHDGFSPLIYAITNGHTRCVELLIDNGAHIEPQKEGDHIPLSLACQYGHKDIALLLLKKGAKITANIEGLYPLHLTSREGHHELSKILTEHGALLDTVDKYNGWSPIFYAASEGHIQCVKVLLDAKCEVNIKDESGRTPIYYAAWEGHIECINLLNSAGGRVNVAETQNGHQSNGHQQNGHQPNGHQPNGHQPNGHQQNGHQRNGHQNGLFDDREKFDANTIPLPPLSLPPPIIPVRIYGHNYLDKKYHVQVTLGHNSAKSLKPPVHLYGNSQISSLKLIVSSKPDMGMIPHSVILPLGDDREVFSFQLDTLENFTLEFDIFPTFGSRVIGRGVVLPYVFSPSDGQDRDLMTGGTGRRCICPLFNTHLKVVGEVSFEFEVVKPFQSVQLEIGGRVETYWKSTNPITLFNSRLELPLVANGFTHSFITASSLSDEYIQIVVQVTRDMIAVVYSDWMLPVDEFDLSVSDVTYKQFKTMGERILNGNKESVDFKKEKNKAKLHKMVHRAYLSLEEVLEHLPLDIGVNIEIKYPTVYEMSNYWFSNIPDINTYVDTILQSVYDQAQATHGNGIGTSSNHTYHIPPVKRSVIFSSFNPAICSAINWKQPNYAVFFNTYCGFESGATNRGKKRKARSEHNVDEDTTYEEVIIRDKRCTSIKEAIKFAKSNNLLGIICEATLLIQVPTLITNVKKAGLMLITFGSANNDSCNMRLQERYGVDAIMIDGVIKYDNRQNVF